MSRDGDARVQTETRPPLAALVQDLFFRSKITEATRHLGIVALIEERPEDFEDAVREERPGTALIVISGGFLALGYSFIRARRVTAHHRSMLTATVFAGLFLVVYVIRWVLLGSKAFPGCGAAYAVYLGILGPHVVLAIAVAPLALI